jgi:hypothetical protein
MTIVVLVAGCPYDPATPEFDAITDTDDADTSDGMTAPSTTIDPTDPDTTDGPSTTAPSTTDDPTVDPTEDPTSDTESSAVCGDGEVNGDEVCDDATNDGSYGGCMPDCDALAPYCGDGEVTDAEVCDDGTNDGSYGGCAAACDELGPNCGDGTMNGEEQCDNGAANENGSGCNVDCVISGSVIGTYVEGGLSFCDGTFVTNPAFRDGNAFIAVTGYCPDDSVVLAEFSPAVEQVQQLDDILLPDTPVYEGTMAGDNWVITAYNCTYSISPMGELTEACMERFNGHSALQGREDGSYIALDYDGLAQYPAGSPQDGDATDWLAVPPDNGSYDYTFSNATLGASDSTIVVGYRRLISNSTYVGYVAQFSAAGNPVDSATFPSVQYLYEVATGSEGGIAVTSAYPDYRLMHLDDNFNEDWGYAVPTTGDILVDIDSTGAVVFAYTDQATSTGVLRKWSADGLTEHWSIEAAVSGYASRMAIAPDDSIWIATATGGGYGVIRVAP